MVRPKGPLFGVDFLEPNALTEGELAKIKVEYHIPDSVMMRIPGPLESLSNLEGFEESNFGVGLRGEKSSLYHARTGHQEEKASTLPPLDHLLHLLHYVCVYELEGIYFGTL
ncbi:unnamed protein product [Prunus armeniaca]